MIVSGSCLTIQLSMKITAFNLLHWKEQKTRNLGKLKRIMTKSWVKKELHYQKRNKII